VLSHQPLHAIQARSTGYSPASGPHATRHDGATVFSMSTNSVQHIDLRIMNSSLPIRGSNVPYAFSTNSSGSIATGVSNSLTTATQDRLIVGVDFGTTYSGG
jgi:hypothetical protein